MSVMYLVCVLFHRSLYPEMFFLSCKHLIVESLSGVISQCHTIDVCIIYVMDKRCCKSRAVHVYACCIKCTLVRHD